MPITRKPLPAESGKHRNLVNKLIAELQAETPTGPKILEEERRGGFLHVTVLWEEWREVEPAERGRIIMDAYLKQRPTEVAKISMALGLTSQEASKLGIEL